MNRNLPTFHDAEYRVKVSHFTQQGFDINGLIHVGANNGYEVQWYKQLGIEHILCFEPAPSAYVAFVQNYPDVPCARVALSDKTGTAVMQITEGDAAGSSLLNTIDESGVVQSWKDNKYVVGKVKVKTVRFDEWADKLPLPTKQYDCLVMDVQGLELPALVGFGRYLDGFKYLNIECSAEPVYYGEASAQEIIDWLAGRGFIQDSPTESHNDIFFVRKDIKAESDKVYRGLA